MTFNPVPKPPLGLLWGLLLLPFIASPLWAADHVIYPAASGSGQGKHVVFLTGDEEYRSEEGLPMLAKILSQRHGFQCTVLFAVDPDGSINPDNQTSLPGAEAIDSADAIVMLLRFRNWPEATMKHFVDAYKRGVPIIALRTSTHAFAFQGAHPYAAFSSFGKKVLGEEWVSHWGNHKKEATRGVIEPAAATNPILRGVTDVFGDTDVYEAHPPSDAVILLRGQVLKGMNPGDPPADYKKKRSTDKQEQGVNDPMMAVAWTRIYENEAGKNNRIFCTTMGAATDLQSEGLRRLVINAVFWGLNMEVPAKADVTYVGTFNPTMYGFKGSKKGVKPDAHALPAPGASAKPKPSAGLPLPLRRGDHIAIIGNGLADRLQHDGWLESFIYKQFPNLDLVVRNLAVTGDEIQTRHRSENFGSPNDWLTKVKADVVFAFFGFNESFKGDAGLDRFKAQLEGFIKETKSTNYNGKEPPRLVLFSPIANERHRDPNFPDPAANNANLRKYADAMAEVARAQGIPFVDLLSLSTKLFDEAAKQGRSLTVNGLHLNDAGNEALAPVMFQSLFQREAPTPSAELEQLRQAVNEKNAQWHGRYRTIDGYNVYGGRSKLSFPSGKDGPKISNFQVMQEEMSQRDVLTANRDQRVWAVANGRDLKLDDSNLPPVTKVRSNKPGPNPDESHVFLGGEEAIGKMTVHSGMQVNLFASEERYPELVNPVQIAWDTRGRLWVAAWLNYPERTPESKTGDSLLVFEDTNADGKADTCTHFLDDLNGPTGFQFYKDGVLVMQAPDLWFVRDTDGDGKGDWKERILMGMDSADSHHTANALAYEPGGAIYLSDGVFHRTQVETALGPVRNNDAAIFRFEPNTGKFETYVSYDFANPHGKVFDRWGNDIITDATGNANYFGPAFSGRLDYPNKHRGMKVFWKQPSRPCAGTELLSSRHFPDEFQDNFLNCNVITYQGIYRAIVREEGSGLDGQTVEGLVSSSDPNFRPTDAKIGPDGAIYFADWHNPIIGHMQHHLRDPNRDHGHGRIYRVTYKGRDLLTPPKIDGQPIPALLELIKAPENLTRTLAKIELGKHDSKQVIAAVDAWAGALDKNEKDYEHRMMEALWIHQWHNHVQESLLKRMLASSEPRARAAATRVLCYWRDRIPNALDLFLKQAADSNARVRLEAVRAASFYDSAQAVDVALAVLKSPMDDYLNYTLSETMRQLEPIWRRALSEGYPIAKDNPAGIDYVFGTIESNQLLKLPRTPGMLQALITRPGIADADRALALFDLSEARKTDRVSLMLDMIEGKGGSKNAAVAFVHLLPAQSRDELRAAQKRLAELTKAQQSGPVRQAGWAALAVADGKFDPTWKVASAQPATTADWLGGIPLITDPDFRGQAYPHVKPLLSSLPASWKGNEPKGSQARFVRVELPRRGTLTLAEVQVFSEGRNIAPQGKAKQSSVSNDGDANRAIDGRTDGNFSSGTQTHTEENDRRPWWELDLGGDRSVESIVVWNRTEGELGKRLDQFTLTLLDNARHEVFKKTANPAPQPSARIAVSGDPVGEVRRAAIRALVSLGREPQASFEALASLISKGQEITSAARAMRVLPRQSWPRPTAGQAAMDLTQWAKAVPAAERTSEDFIETVQTATELSGLLPKERAAALRHDLSSLRVAVFILRTVREQMRYDTPRLVVEAGKPFEIVLINDDFMPHNLAIMNPGARPKLGPTFETMKPDQLDGQGRPYLPSSPDILAATKLIEAGARTTLKTTAPTTEGDYEYVCTFPGHWSMMWGTLVVTKDVEAYLAAHPEAPPQPPAAAHQHHE